MGKKKEKVEQSAFTETQRERCKGHKWKMVMHLNCDDKGVRQDHCEGLGITKLVVTPKTKGQWGLGKVTYIIDADGREFDSLHECLNAMGIE